MRNNNRTKDPAPLIGVQGPGSARLRDLPDSSSPLQGLFRFSVVQLDRNYHVIDKTNISSIISYFGLTMVFIEITMHIQV